jgi:ribosomal protein S18 acetylase RimI-like enzyme
MHPLENPTWAALTSYQEQHALIAAKARRFRPELTVHGALADQTPGAWRDLQQLADDAPVSLFSPQALELPPGWTITRSVELYTMVQEEDAARPGTESPTGKRSPVKDEAQMVQLSANDLPQMSLLYEATRPGRKLYHGLIELGGFWGIKDAGRVVAMACLRLHFPGYREISTVGTLPGHEGRGYATALVGELVRRIRAAGETPFLTVRTDNARAIEIYKRLGFSERGRLRSTTVRFG